MNSEITVTQTMNLSDSLMGGRWHQRRFRWKRWMQWPVGIVAVFTIYYLAKTSHGEKVDMFVFFVSFGCVTVITFGVALFDRSLTRHKLQKVFQELPSGQRVLNWKFQEEGAECTSEGSYSLIEWPRFTESVSSPDGVLIYLTKNSFHWLPKKVFTSEADYNRFLGLLSVKTKHTKLG